MKENRVVCTERSWNSSFIWR